MTLLQIILTTVLGVALATVALFSSTPTHNEVTFNASSTPPISTPIEKTVVPIQSEKKPVVVATKPPAPAQKENPTLVPTTPTNTEATETTAASIPTTTTSPAPTLTAKALNDTVRASVVNIICTTKTSGPFNSISASGVIIDSRGIILTNAHVGQYFLLKNYPSPGFVDCVIRTGSPAVPTYTAKLLYISPSWVAKNASKINSEEPTGNGEHDYAFLLITGTVNPSTPMPSSFPALSISVDPPSPKQTAFLAAYPAGFLGGITVSKNLYETSAFATVGGLYTFDSDTLDLFSIGGTIISQHGSSGGAVTDESGTLLGLIVTATDAASTASRDLRAISTPYIIRDFENEKGTSLQNYLSGDVAAEAATFNANTAPALTQQLVNALEGK